MSQPYIGEIRMIAANFAPQGWLLCDGSTQSIANYETLFTLIGTTYGGDGVSTFNLPDLRGRAPIHQGNGFVIGQSSGVETVTVTPSQLPIHTHVPLAASAGSGLPANSPAGNVWSGWTGGQFSSQAPTAQMSPAAVSNDGGSQPHDNMVPFQAVNFIISLFGIYPSQT
jgi:microcystin-dependent protein